MNFKPQVTCIIPFYNEGERLYQVLQEIIKTRNITEIICVDDASEEDQSAEIKQHFPKIQLLRLSQNLGKSGAVHEGLKRATGDFILLLDADLQNLQYQEIEEAIQALQNHSDIDMLLLRRVNAYFFVKWNRADTLFTGERILRKSDLERVFEEEIRGWQLEAAINNYMYEEDKKVYWMPQSATNTHKTVKWSLWYGIKNELRTFADMMFAMGFGKFLKQFFFFAKEELKLEAQPKTIHLNE